MGNLIGSGTTQQASSSNQQYKYQDPYAATELANRYRSLADQSAYQRNLMLGGAGYGFTPGTYRPASTVQAPPAGGGQQPYLQNPGYPNTSTYNPRKPYPYEGAGGEFGGSGFPTWDTSGWGGGYGDAQTGETPIRNPYDRLPSTQTSGRSATVPDSLYSSIRAGNADDTTGEDPWQPRSYVPGTSTPEGGPPQRYSPPTTPQTGGTITNTAGQTAPDQAANQPVRQGRSAVVPDVLYPDQQPYNPGGGPTDQSGGGFFDPSGGDGSYTPGTPTGDPMQGGLLGWINSRMNAQGQPTPEGQGRNELWSSITGRLNAPDQAMPGTANDIESYLRQQMTQGDQPLPGQAKDELLSWIRGRIGAQDQPMPGETKDEMLAWIRGQMGAQNQPLPGESKDKLYGYVDSLVNSQGYDEATKQAMRQQPALAAQAAARTAAGSMDRRAAVMGNIASIPGAQAQLGSSMAQSLGEQERQNQIGFANEQERQRELGGQMLSGLSQREQAWDTEQQGRRQAASQQLGQYMTAEQQWANEQNRRREAASNQLGNYMNTEVGWANQQNQNRQQASQQMQQFLNTQLNQQNEMQRRRELASQQLGQFYNTDRSANMAWSNEQNRRQEAASNQMQQLYNTENAREIAALSGLGNLAGLRSGVQNDETTQGQHTTSQGQDTLGNLGQFLTGLLGGKGGSAGGGGTAGGLGSAANGMLDKLFGPKGNQTAPWWNGGQSTTGYEDWRNGGQLGGTAGYEDWGGRGGGGPYGGGIYGGAGYYGGYGSGYEGGSGGYYAGGGYYGGYQGGGGY